MASKKEILSNGAAMLFSRSKTTEAAQEKPAAQNVPAGGVFGRGRPRKGDPEPAMGRNKVTTTLSFNEAQYLKLREIAYNERLSLRETMFLLLQEGISKYERTGKLPK